MTEKAEMMLAQIAKQMSIFVGEIDIDECKEEARFALNAIEKAGYMVVPCAAAASAEPVAWRTRWKTGSERDREWEMWTYRTEQPAPNDQQIIEPLYAHPIPLEQESHS